MPDTTNISGGVKFDGGPTSITGDVVSRDKIVQAAPDPVAQYFHQLPPAPGDFVGREAEQQDLLNMIERGAVITGLRGMGGIGKTALGLVITHQLKKRYPDAQFFLDLRGAGDNPVTPLDALTHVVRAFYPTSKFAAALSACGLRGTYSLFPIQPEDKPALQTLLTRVRAGGIHGLNVTIPHKQNVIPFMDELTPTAQAIGAVNVIYLRGERLIGDNTDAPCFLDDLKKSLTTETRGHRESNALVLGAGGSARSVVYALLNDGWQVTVAARRLEQAQQLVSQFEGAIPAELNLQAFQRSNLELIVNTTPIGMTPNVDQSPLPENVVLAPHTKIYDLVYNPRETKLVRDARAQGSSGIGGFFKIFF